jgi:hypothetical protein
VFKVGAVVLTNTWPAFKSPTIVCDPVNGFAEASFSVESNAVCNQTKV